MLDNAELTPAESLTPELPVADDFSFLADLDAPDSSEGADPPLPTSDETKPVAVPQGKPEENAIVAKPEEAAKPAEGAEAEEIDPDLTEEENRDVNSLPKPARAQARRHAKEAKLYQDVLNPAKTGEEIRQAVHALSASRAADLEQAVINARLAEPEKFFNGLDDETYGKLVTSAYAAHPEGWNKFITGRDGISQQDIREALEFQDKNRDRVPSGDAAFKDEEIEGIDEELDRWLPEHADKIKAAIRQTGEAKAKPAEAAKPEEKKTEEAKPADQTDSGQPVAYRDLTPEQSDVWKAGYQPIEEFFTSKLESQLGLTISAKEWETAPTVARAKQAQIELMRKGGGTLPPFEEGLVETFKDNEKFSAAMKSWMFYTLKGEKPNAKAAGETLKPFVDKYMDERAKSAEYQYYDGLSQLAAKFPQLTFAQMAEVLAKHAKTIPHEPHQPGAPSPGKTNKPEDLNDFLLNLE